MRHSSQQSQKHSNTLYLYWANWEKIGSIQSQYSAWKDGKSSLNWSDRSDFTTIITPKRKAKVFSEYDL